MNVLVVSNAAWPVVGGIEVLIDRLLPAVRDRGHAVTLLTSALSRDAEATSERHGIMVHRTQIIAALARRDPALLSRERQRVKRLVDELQPDLIHAHDPGPNLWAIIKSGSRAPVLTTMHIGVQRAGAGSAVSIAELLRASAWVTGVSQSAIDEVLSIEPSLAGRTSVIENGVAMSAAEPGAVVPGRVLCIGRLVPQKGFDIALRAFALVVAGRSSAHLVIAGDGAERSSLETLAVELDIADRVTFLGVLAHADIAGLLAEAQLVALPSRYEGQPLVALEAGSAGRPVVSTSVDGLAAVVVDGETGVIVPTEDVAGLAAGLARLLDDPALCDRLGAAARARIEERYRFDRCVDAYLALYHRLVPGAD